MKVLLLRSDTNKPYTVLVRGVFKKRFYQVFSDNAVIELPVMRYKEPK